LSFAALLLELSWVSKNYGQLFDLQEDDQVDERLLRKQTA
jgi:hypothetical protein